MKAYSMLVLCGALTLSGCFTEESKAPEAVVSSKANPSASQKQINDIPQNIYAMVGDQAVTKSHVDKILELKLFDLEWAAYEMRRQVLATEVEKLAAQQDGKAPVKVMIQPPWPPRLAHKTEGNVPTFGKAKAPVTLSIFCSYPSSHCARMMPTYQALADEYTDAIRMEFIDFPQKFHFNAGNAAVAAHCANQHGQFWRYHKGLFSRFDELGSNEVFIKMARQVGIDPEAFGRCLSDKQHIKQVESNLNYAQSLGLSKVPVTLINGLFINGPRSLDTLRYYIDKELETKGAAKPTSLQMASSNSEEDTLPLSQLPLRLEGISLHSNSKQSSASINHFDESVSHTYQEDDQIMEGVYLVMIREQDIVIENAGQLERLAIVGGQLVHVDPAPSDLRDSNTPDQAQNSQQETTETLAAKTPKRRYRVEPEEVPNDLEYSYRGVVEPKGETPLSRAWIQDELVYREQLGAHFQPAELDVEGYKLMRLTEIKDNDFYETLGLQDKDVIMRVNEQWVHSGQNTLFEQLENEEEVSIVLMRKGLPIHIHYAIN